MCETGEKPKLWNKTYVKSARKKHICCECDSVISPGESYINVFAVYDCPETFKFCEVCYSKWNEYHLELEDCSIGSLWETIEEFE